jgi:hypothetical protein
VVVFRRHRLHRPAGGRYLNESYREGRAVAWASAGRKLDKLEEVRERIGAFSALLLQADASDASARDCAPCAVPRS